MGTLAGEGGPVAWVLAGVYALLGTASVVAVAWRRCSAQVRARIASWWVLLLIGTAALWTGRWGVVLLGATASALALNEFLTLLSPSVLRVRPWLLASVPLQYACIAWDWHAGFLAVLPVYLFLLVPMLLMLDGRTRGFVAEVGGAGFGAMLTVWGLGHASYLAAAPSWSAHAGLGAAVFLVVLTELNDVAQFLFGRALGRRAVVPAVSPGKTLEGLLGGLVTTVLLAAVLAPRLTDLSGGHAALAGVLIGLGGFVGDVVMSCVKRDAGVKDASRLIPGHGGVLDRVDSLTFTAPLFFHFLHLLAR